MKLFQILESTETRTKATNDVDSSIDDLLNPTADNPIAKQETKNKSVSHKVANKERTRSRMSNVDVGDEGHAHMANLSANVGDIEDDYEYGEQVTTPGTIPAVIQSAMAKTGDTEFEIDWHQVRNLPGYMQQGIRMMGKQIFATVTDTPIDQIQVLANLNGKGPNSTEEIMALGGWLKQNAIQDRKFDMNFSEMMPGYNAEVAVFNSNNATFMLVKDFAGQYVYSWPGGRGTQLGKDKSLDSLEVK